MPFNNLLERVVFAVVAREAIGVDKRAKRITTLYTQTKACRATETRQHLPFNKITAFSYSHLISAVRVHFASRVVRLDADVDLIEATHDEKIRGCTKKLDACECAYWNDTGTMIWLRAPRNGRGLCVTDRAVRGRRAPQAEVCAIL